MLKPPAASSHATLFWLLLFVIAPAPLDAQQSSPAVEFSAGPIAFTEATETFVAGTGRLYVRPRLSVGPEVTYIFGERHSHLVVTGNVIYDFLRWGPGQPRRWTPFGVAGGGFFQTREELFVGDYTSTEGAFTAGGGVRTLLGDRIILGGDVRIGWELHIRVGGTIGVRFGQ
jgi:hypothetical protein